MYDLNSNNPNPVINYDGVSKNITSVGFHEDGRWMYTGGEDCMARIWDLRYWEGRSPMLKRIHCVFDKSNFDPLRLHPGQEICSVRGYSRSTLRSTVYACIPTRWGTRCTHSVSRVCSCCLNKFVNSHCCMFFRPSWSLETRVEWFISGIWRPTTMNSSFLSQRSRSTQFTSTQMPVTWQRSTARSVSKQS